MSIFLTPLGSDNFTRANENPLSQGGNWTQDSYGDPNLQIVSDVCEGTLGGYAYNGNLYSGVSLPNDQYASVTLPILPSLVTGANFSADIRLTDNGSSFSSILPRYFLYLYGSSAGHLGWTLYTAGFASIGMGTTPYTVGDVFTLAAIGTTIYILQNGTQLASVTNSSYSSGIAALESSYSSSPSETKASNFVVGSASTTGSISGNAGVAGATVSYSGTASGSVTAGAGGVYSITGLAAGSYTITPTLGGYTFSPTSQNVTLTAPNNQTGINFTAMSSIPPGPTATADAFTWPSPAQIFGVISSGPHAGAVAAVACDSNGNLAISGGSGGSINTIDILGSIADAIPVLVVGAVSGSTVPGSTALFGVNCDQFGNLICTTGTNAGGNSYPALDTPTANDCGAVPIQIFARDPAGFVIGVVCGSNGSIGNTIKPITNVPITVTDERSTENQFPVPVVLCARIAQGYPNAGALVMVSLDQNGCLCVAGSSGSATTPGAILDVNQGQPQFAQIYGRTSAGALTSVPLTSTGSLLLN